MDMINSESELFEKLNEIASCFNMQFEMDSSDTYLIRNNTKYKMKKESNVKYVTIDGEKVYLRFGFAPHLFSNSALIELYIDRGTKKEACRLEQEMQINGSGTSKYPRFYYSKLDNNGQASIFTNGFSLEMTDANCVDSYMNRLIGKYSKPIAENKLNIVFNRHIKNFIFGVVNESDHYRPCATIETIDNLLGHKMLLSDPDFGKVYNEHKEVYRYDKNTDLYLLPYISSSLSVGEKQFVEGLDNLSQDEWKNLFISIVTNYASVICYKNVIESISKEPIFDFISNYYGNLIKFVGDIQSSKDYSYFEDKAKLICKK